MYRRYFKRLFDIVISLLFMPFLMIIILIVGLVIKLTDGGPVFYLGYRLGQNGSTFKMYKFRTMKVNALDFRNADGSTFNSEDDPRLLKSGKILRKSSIDELPQFINVLIGDMSVIGPRPDLPEMINEYSESERLKLNVKPGITGYSQAYYRNSVSQKDKFNQDNYYATNYSFKMDIKIFAKTVETVLLRRNVFKGRNDE